VPSVATAAQVDATRPEKQKFHLARRRRPDRVALSPCPTPCCGCRLAVHRARAPIAAPLDLPKSLTSLTVSMHRAPRRGAHSWGAPGCAPSPEGQLFALQAGAIDAAKFAPLEVDMQVAELQHFQPLGRNG
jgi:hypothetical protein